MIGEAKMHRHNTDHPRDRDYRTHQRHNSNSPSESRYIDDSRPSIYNPRDRDYRDNKSQTQSNTGDIDDHDPRQNSNGGRRSDQCEDTRRAQQPEEGLVAVWIQDPPIIDEADCLIVGGILCFLFDDAPPHVVNVGSDSPLQDAGICDDDILFKVNDKDIGNPYLGKAAISELLRQTSLPLKLTFVKRNFTRKYLPNYIPPSSLLFNDNKGATVSNIENASPPPTAPPRATDCRDQRQNSISPQRHHDYRDRLQNAQPPEKGVIVVHARDAPIFDEFVVDDVVVHCVAIDGVCCFLSDDSPPAALAITSDLQEAGIGGRGRDILLKVNDKDIGNPYPGKAAISDLLRKSNLPLKLTFVNRDFIGKYLPNYIPPSRLLEKQIDDTATIVTNILNVRLAHIQFPCILNVKNFAGDPLVVVAKTEADLLYPNFIIKCAHALKSLVSLLTGIEMSDTESPTDEEGNLNPKIVLTKNSIIDVEKEYRIVEAARDFNEKTKNWKTELCDTELMKPENEIFLAEWIHFRCFEQLEMKNYRPVIMSRRHSILTAKLCEYGELDKLKYEVSLPAFPWNSSPAFDYVEKHNIISDLLYDDGYYFEQEDDDWILLSRGPQRHAGGDNLEIWRRCTWAARTCFMMLLHTRIGISHNQIWAWLNIFQPRNGKTLLDWTGNTLLDLRLNLNGHRASHLKWFSRDAAIEASMITRDRMNFSSMTPPRNVGRDYLQNRRKAEQQRCSYEYGQNHSPKNSLEGPKRALFRRMTETIRHTEQVDTFFEYHDVTDAFYDDAPEFKDTDCDSELRQLPTVNLVAVDPPNFYENWDNPMFINLLNFLHCHLEVPHAHSFSAALAIGTEGCWPSSDTAKCVAQQAVWMRKFLRPKKEILYEHSISMDTRLTQEKRLGFDHSMLTDFRVLRSIRELQRSNKVWKVVSQENNSSCWSINPQCIKNAREKSSNIIDLVELYRYALRKTSPVTEGRRRAVVGVQLSNGSMMSGELCWECY